MNADALDLERHQLAGSLQEQLQQQVLQQDSRDREECAMDRVKRERTA